MQERTPSIPSTTTAGMVPPPSPLLPFPPPLTMGDIAPILTAPGISSTGERLTSSVTLCCAMREREGEGGCPPMEDANSALPSPPSLSPPPIHVPSFFTPPPPPTMLSLRWLLPPPIFDRDRWRESSGGPIFFSGVVFLTVFVSHLPTSKLLASLISTSSVTSRLCIDLSLSPLLLPPPSSSSSSSCPSSTSPLSTPLFFSLLFAGILPNSRFLSPLLPSRLPFFL
mmetsp:Transcript_5867/g.13903  ORF Transcript_5867/g.13903 Transcript_5867/m.13903 type:complete len:226 (+) Transcript_5867:201-878(+)